MMDGETSGSGHNIGQWYDGATIFITGATGFVGKALLEKLLRSCGDIRLVYILVRQHRGMAPDLRLKELLKSPVFDKIRDKCPSRLDKVRVICGDVSLPDLGLSPADRSLLVEEVNVVFHSAATVKFNESLRDAVVLNTLGSQRVIQLCRQMRQLRSAVHVSTAYSNADKRVVEEVVYPPPHDPKAIIKCVEELPNEALVKLAKALLGKHPNTYTLTKAMAEHIVSEEGRGLPLAIVRPSIVTSAWQEPVPGWVDNMSGITGIMMEIGRGTIKSIICDDRLIIDLIPVDVLASTLIAAAWHTATAPGLGLRVYNCTSGQVNGIQWRDYGGITLKYAQCYPSKYISLYPAFHFRTNRFVHWLVALFYHALPACVYDLLLYATNNKPIMLKICRKFARTARDGTFFALNEFDFANGNLRALIAAVAGAQDGAAFPVDMGPSSGFRWDPYVKDYMLGIRQYVLKDDIRTLPAAKKKMQRLYWIQKAIQAVPLYFLYKWSMR